MYLAVLYFINKEKHQILSDAFLDPDDFCRLPDDNDAHD